jgi:hypothetical protein|tara:strand:+ start:2808 stop:4529 length:1722 start_codon:yes stop_codon:yes gene_type:complete
MAVKSYIVSFEHQYIDGDSANFNKSATESALTGAGATIDANFDHSVVGMYKIDIEESSIGDITSLANYVASENVTDQADATLLISEDTSEWHKQRLVTRNLPLRTTYDPVYTGAGSTVYLMDSGVDTGHPEFSGKSFEPVFSVTASPNSFAEFIEGGKVATDYDTTDRHGHGTAMASLINGATYGVAGGASIGIVKISDSSVDSGAIKLENVLNSFKAIAFHDVLADDTSDGNRRGASTVCMAWSFSKSQVLDRYVSWMHNRQGFLMVAAAGNNGGDVDNFSPAGINDILTVGASDSSDNVPAFSNDAGTVVEQGSGLQTNGGEEVDVFAPGVGVNYADISNRVEVGNYTGVTGDDLKANGNGTSISCAIVAGIGAMVSQRYDSGKATADALKELIIEQSLTGLLFQDPGLYSSTPNNIVFVENEYYATVWNTAAGNLGDFLLSGAGDIDISLNVANTVTDIASSDFAALPPALTLSGNASAGWNITANTSVTGGMSNTTIYNFILTATKSDNTKYNRHFSVSLFGGSEVSEDERNLGSETYFVNDGGTLSEVVYGSGQYSLGNDKQGFESLK